MKALTFAWEFPPHTTGGLGMACQGLMRELTAAGVDVLFVLPKQQPVHGTGRFIFANVLADLTAEELKDFYAFGPYHHSSSKVALRTHTINGEEIIYAPRLIQAVHQFAHQAAAIAKREEFDVIHAHDWTSYLAGVAAKLATGKPLILHVHATSFDQAGGDNVDPSIYKIEKEAFDLADRVVTVSGLTRDIIVHKHGVPADKIEVIYNGTDVDEAPQLAPTLQELKAQGKKIVLYHGRITIQKGVDYFVQAAAKVVRYDPAIIFVISGKGDMEEQIMQQVAANGLSEHVRFAGALWGEDRDRMYQAADLLVMPSVSEPFGLVPLEAIRFGTPSIISKQSGVAEVFTHALKVDFWDVDEMANQILAATRYSALHGQLKESGRQELWRFHWRAAAEKVKDIYHRLVQWGNKKIA
jgi:glycogen(starch) synthase